MLCWAGASFGSGAVGDVGDAVGEVGVVGGVWVGASERFGGLACGGEAGEGPEADEIFAVLGERPAARHAPVTPNIVVHSTPGSDPYLAETPANPDTVSLPDSTSTAGADAVPSTPCEAVTAGCGTNTTPETNALETNLEQGTATEGAAASSRQQAHNY